MQKRIKTSYPGVFYYIRNRIGSKGTEKVYYIIFKKNGKNVEEKVGRQFSDSMTPAKAASIRSQRIEGKRLSRKEIKEIEEKNKLKTANKWTIERLWIEYNENNSHLKMIKSHTSNYNRYIGPNLGAKEPNEILPLDIERLKRKLLKELAPQTVKHVLKLLSRIVNYGNGNKRCNKLDFRIEMPEVHNQKTEDLSNSELIQLLKAIEEDDHPQAGAMMKLVLFTGMRRGELFKLKWNDIDFDKGFIHIRDPKGKVPQKIPLSRTARELLRTHHKTDGSPFVFPGRDGKQRTKIDKQVNRIKKHAGLPKDFRPLHGLRHVYASMLASSGKVDLYTLQKLLTHKNPIMTQRYAHLRDEVLKKASGLAGSLIEQASKNINKAQSSKSVEPKK